MYEVLRSMFFCKAPDDKANKKPSSVTSRGRAVCVFHRKPCMCNTVLGSHKVWKCDLDTSTLCSPYPKIQCRSVLVSMTDLSSVQNKHDLVHGISIESNFSHSVIWLRCDWYPLVGDSYMWTYLVMDGGREENFFLRKNMFSKCSAQKKSSTLLKTYILQKYIFLHTYLLKCCLQQ